MLISTLNNADWFSLCLIYLENGGRFFHMINRLILKHAISSTEFLKKFQMTLTNMLFANCTYQLFIQILTLHGKCSQSRWSINQGYEFFHSFSCALCYCLSLLRYSKYKTDTERKLSWLFFNLFMEWYGSLQAMLNTIVLI